MSLVICRYRKALFFCFNYLDLCKPTGNLYGSQVSNGDIYQLKGV